MSNDKLAEALRNARSFVSLFHDDPAQACLDEIDAALQTHADEAAQAQVAQDVDAMVARFLAWRLPENFSPDCGISFAPEYNSEYMAKQGKPPMRHEPVGTNLFDADQARAMILHILGATAKESGR